MAAKAKLTTRCPTCGATYHVLSAIVGRHASCTRCRQAFRVAEYNPRPTEEDILRWLNEGLEEYDFPSRARSFDTPPAGLVPPNSAFSTGSLSAPASA